MTRIWSRGGRVSWPLRFPNGSDLVAQDGGDGGGGGGGSGGGGGEGWQ